MPSEIKRNASLHAAAEQFEVEPDHIELSLDHHNSVNNPEMTPFLSKIGNKAIRE